MNAMHEIQIRPAGVGDVDKIMAVYESARRYMRRCGNKQQWVSGYPAQNDIEADIEAGNCYVGIDASGDIAVVFAFITGRDHTYDVIDGAWLNDAPYGTIHRMASCGKYPGMLRLCVEYCMRRVSDLRLDTHEVNIPMRKAAERLGFKRCGIIICRDGTPRIAYHKTAAHEIAKT